MPRVSVIVPTYNRAATLPRAISSVLGQTYTDWELIVVDDGSTDDTRSLVERYAAGNGAIRYLWQENAKQAAARNLGIRNAKGEYIAFLDSDDTWLPDKLEAEVAILDRSPEIGMVYGNQLDVADDRDPGRLRYPPGRLKSGNIFGDLSRRRFDCSTPTLLVRRSVLDRVGPFDERFRNALEDWELTLRIAFSYPVACIERPLFRRYANKDYSRDYALIRAANHKAILEKAFANFPVAPEERRKIWRSAWFAWGASFLENGYYAKAVGSFAQALRLGHRFAGFGLFLSVMGPLGRWIYAAVRRLAAPRRRARKVETSGNA